MFVLSRGIRRCLCESVCESTGLTVLLSVRLFDSCPFSYLSGSETVHVPHSGYKTLSCCMSLCVCVCVRCACVRRVRVSVRACERARVRA